MLLLITGATGLMLLVLRESTWMPALLALHLGPVLALFLLLPYGKFVHGIYRALALGQISTRARPHQPLRFRVVPARSAILLRATSSECESRMTDSLNKVLRRELVAGAGHLMPGAANALAARLIEAAGYKMMMLSGAAVANTYLGMPDIGLVSVTELAGTSRRCAMRSVSRSSPMRTPGLAMQSMHVAP